MAAVAPRLFPADIEMVDVLSLTQPWASLMACDEKRYETRGWPYRHRGLLAVAAALSFPLEAREDRLPPAAVALSPPAPEELAFGNYAIVGGDRRRRHAFVTKRVARLARPFRPALCRYQGAATGLCGMAGVRGERCVRCGSLLDEQCRAAGALVPWKFPRQLIEAAR